MAKSGWPTWKQLKKHFVNNRSEYDDSFSLSYLKKHYQKGYIAGAGLVGMGYSPDAKPGDSHGHDHGNDGFVNRKDHKPSNPNGTRHEDNEHQGRNPKNNKWKGNPKVKYSTRKWKWLYDNDRIVRGSVDHGRADAITKWGARQVFKRWGDFFSRARGHHAWRASDPYPFHPQGSAFDFMVPDWQSQKSIETGWEVAKWLVKNASSLKVDHVIWQQQVWSRARGSWRDMGGRGSPTANHMDHLHVNFIDNAKVDKTLKIKEPKGGFTIPGGSGGNGGNNTSGGGSNDVTPKDGDRSMYKGKTAQAAFRNTLMNTLGFSQEDATELAKMVRKAKSEEQAMGLIYGSDIYKERFAGNELRKEAGLTPLTGREYIGQEEAYRDALSLWGLESTSMADQERFADCN